MPPPPRSLTETRRRVPLFNELLPDQIAALATMVSTEKYSAGRVVFSEDDPGGDLLILKEGSVRVVKTAASGRQQLISIEREGSSLGEVSVFDGGSYSTTAIAITPIVLLRMKGGPLEAFVRRLRTSPSKSSASWAIG